MRVHPVIFQNTTQDRCKKIFPTDKFKDIETPFYYYDSDLLHETLEKINEEVKRHEGFVVHYAIKLMPTHVYLASSIMLV